MADTFLIVFQRNLFSLVHTWEAFFEFTAYSFAFEMATFFYCMTEHYEELHDSILKYAEEFNECVNPKEKYKLKNVVCYLYAITHSWQDGKFFVSKNALYISYRFLLRLQSTLAYMLFQVFLRYG